MYNMAMATSATYVSFARPGKADDLRADGKQDEADPQSLPHILGGDSKQNRPSSEHHKKYVRNEHLALNLGLSPG